jgi:hypothetical protein
MERDDPAEIQTFARFVRERCSASRDHFLSAFSVPILVQMSEPSPGPRTPHPPTPLFGTIVLASKPLRAKAIPLAVHPIAKRDSNPFTAMVTVGRAPNNDVVLSYDEISKFHAFFLHTGTGWTIVDAHSTNGTFVGLKRLAPPAPFALDLSSGSVDLAFSGIKAVLYTPERFYEIAHPSELVA